MNVLGLSEVRWKGQGDYMSDDYRIIYSGGEKGQRGVAVVLDRMMSGRVTKVIQCNERVMLVRMKNELVDIVIIQVYMPTSDSEDEEVEEMYEKIEELIKGEKATDQVIIMGDWNAVVGEVEGGR